MCSTLHKTPQARSPFRSPAFPPPPLKNRTICEALGVQPHQRSSAELQYLGCTLAVFVPFATAARLLRWYSATSVSPRAVWAWVQAAGKRAIAELQTQLDEVARGEQPVPERLEADLARRFLRFEARYPSRSWGRGAVDRRAAPHPRSALISAATPFAI